MRLSHSEHPDGEVLEAHEVRKVDVLDSREREGGQCRKVELEGAESVQIPSELVEGVGAEKAVNPKVVE